MKNKLAIFDLDGTLFDTSLVNYFSYKEALNEQGYDIECNYFCDYCNGRHYLEFIPQIVGNNEQLLKLIHTRKKELYKNYLANARENTVLFEIISAIKKDYYIALVTTASKRNAYDILDYFGKKESFDLILTQEEIKNKKPDPEGFIKAMQYFNIDDKNTVIFEDADVGIQSAKATGSPSIFKIESF